MTTATAPAKFNVSGDRDDLLSAFATAERFTAKIASNPAAQMIRLVNTEEGEGYVEATNLSMAVRTALWGAWDASPVDVLLSAKVRRALDALPPGEVTLAVDGGICEVRGKGKARYQAGVSVHSWPAFKVGDHIDWEAIDATSAKETIKSMEFAARFASRSDTNPSITGVNVRPDGDGNVVVSATDTYRLYQTRVSSEGLWQPGDGPAGDITVPLAMVAELGRLFPDGELKMAADDNMFYAAAPDGGTYFSSRRIGGRFPDVDKLFPKLEEFGWRVKVPRNEVRETLGRMRSMVDANAQLRVTIEDDEMILSARGGEGLAEEYVDLPAEHKKIEIGFNLGNILSALEALDGDEVEVRLAAPLRPAWVDNGTATRMLVMPVRLT